MEKGSVFNIERYAIHDGPGIRTVVFLKGCPLRCKWCSNPESQSLRSEVFHSAAKCLGGVLCGACARACPRGAVQNINGALSLDREKCAGCGACARACPAAAMTLQGTPYTVEQVMEQVAMDEPFYRHSGGGVTVSGGEPLVQAAFAAALLERCRRRHLSTCVETTGYGDWEKLASLARFTDLFLYDIKHMDSARHREGTGVGNERILENLRRLSESFPEASITVRTPVIPGFNDRVADITAIARFLAPLPNVAEYTLLPFHSFGESKYAALDRPYPVDAKARVPEELMEQLRAAAGLAQYR